MKHILNTSLMLLALLMPATAIAYDIEVDGIYYNINDNQAAVMSFNPTYNFYNEDAEAYIFDIPSTITCNSATYPVTTIGDRVFSNCYYVYFINIPNSVTSIGNNAFSSSYLSGILIPNSVKFIGDAAFAGCELLVDIDIPNSVASIGNYAFYECTNLYNINIPNSVTTIGDGAFAGCLRLFNIDIPNSVTAIGAWAFMDTPWYDSQPDGLIYAGLVAYSYKGTMTENTRITLQDGTLGIADNAFEGYSSLTCIDIPSSVKTIGYKVFYDCSSLNDVYSDISDPSEITMGSDVFYRNPNNYDARTLHVPTGSVEAYQADTRWSGYFGSIVEPEPVPAEAIKLNVTTAGLNEGASLQLTATVLPENSDKNVLWSSNNPSVATVDSNGLVTTHSVGTATITAMTTDGSNLSSSCTVTLLPVGVKGDMNGDGNITITDVTSLIDYLLSN